MEYLKFSPSTAGEHLFQYIISTIIGKESQTELRNTSILKAGGRATEFFEYFLGTYSFNFTGRCIRKAKSIRNSIEDENLHHRLLINYFQKTLEIPEHPGERNLERLAALTFEAVYQSGKKISKQTKKNVRHGKDICTCYICGKQILLKSQTPDEIVKYEHIWPSSYGGNSIVDNLLPACEKCNDHKADMLLWQDSHVHSFVLSPTPSEEEWKKIKRSIKIAKHRSRIFEIACANELTLKEAAIEAGPIDTEIASLHSIDEDDCIDFFNLSIKEKA
ncbi:MAG: HNH endonuclease [Pseudomonadaceae bacterium]